MRFKFAILAIVLTPLPGAGASPDVETFEKVVRPFLEEHCLSCHSARSNKGGLNLDEYKDARTVEQGRDQWERVREVLKRGQMPPRPIPKAPDEQVMSVLKWLEQEFARQDKKIGP